MVLEQQPTSPKATQFPPASGEEYKVRSGESWNSIAGRFGLDVWKLIEFNFPVVNEAPSFDSKCRQVNWLMRTHVGCKKSSDGKNYSFDSSDWPGMIYVPARPLDPAILAQLRVYGSPEPAGLPAWSQWSPSSYQEAVKAQCAKIYASDVGKAVIQAIKRPVAIRPLRHYRDFLPVYVPSEGTAYYMPGVFIPTSRSYVPASQLIVGGTADASLLHELVHAMRHASGRWLADQEEISKIHYPPWTSGKKASEYLFFGTRGEFNAIVITNIYISEINPGRLDPTRRDHILLVKDHELSHANRGLAAPKQFHKTSKIKHYLNMLWDDQEELCVAIAKVNAEFNPIRDVRKDS
jgi:hypothetical protein